MKAVVLVLLLSAVALASVVSPNTRISDVVIADHKALVHLANSLSSAQNEIVKRDIVNQIINLLETHGRLEDLIVYPIVRERVSNGVQLANKAQQDHEQIKKRSSNVKQGKVEETALRQFVDDAVAHSKFEEQEILPVLEQAIGTKESNEIASRWVLEHQRVAREVFMEYAEAAQGTEDDSEEGHWGGFGGGFGHGFGGGFGGFGRFGGFGGYPGMYGGYGYGYPGMYGGYGYGYPGMYGGYGYGYPGMYGGYGYGYPGMYGGYGYGYPSYGGAWW